MTTGATVSSFSAALKNVYLPGIREELNEKTNLLDLFTEGDLTQYEWQGNQLVFALHSSRNYCGVMYVCGRRRAADRWISGHHQPVDPDRSLEGPHSAVLRSDARFTVR